MNKNIIFLLVGILLFSGCSNTAGYDYLIDYYELLNHSYPSLDTFHIIASGSGATKTTTGVIDNTIYESFGVGDELYGQWVVPSTIDTNRSVELSLHFFIDVVEIGKKANFSFYYTIIDGNRMVNITSISGNSGDFNVSENAFETFEYKVQIPGSLFEACNEGHCIVNGKIVMEASSNTPTADINLYNMHVDFYDYKPSLETTVVNNYYNGTIGNVTFNGTLWYLNGTELHTNATAVNIGGYKMYDNGTDFVFEMN